MKQSFLKFSGKKFLSVALLAAAVLLTSVSSHAAAPLANIEILSGNNSSVQFTGSIGNALLFKVHVSNEKGDNFTLSIKDGNGNTLFSKSFNDTDFDKQFKILKGEEEGTRYYFTLSSSNKDLEETYAVSSVTRTVNDVTVNKL